MATPKAAAAATRESRFPFGIPTVEKSQYALTVNDSKRSKSVAVLTVAVPILSCGLTVNATVWVSIPKTGPDAGKLVIEANPNGRHVTFTEENDRDTFNGFALKAATSYRGWDALEEKAVGLLTGKTTKTANPKMAPRLVRTIGGKPTTVAPAPITDDQTTETTDGTAAS